MAKHLKAGGTAVEACAARVETVQEVMAKVAAVEACAARVDCTALESEVAKHVTEVGERAPEATEKEVAAEGEMVQQRVRAVVVSGVKAKAAVMVVVTREAAGWVAGRVAAAAAETAAATAEMATVRYREGMAAGAGTVTVRRSTGLTERRAGTYSPEDDGEATVLPIERVRTSLRTG